MRDRGISCKGNMPSWCVTPAYTNTPEMMALTEKHHEKVQVVKNNLVRIIMGELIRENYGLNESGGWNEGKF